MSRVFVVSEPLRWSEATKQWVRSMDLRPARAHGELVFLMPPNNEGPTDPAVAIAALWEKLVDFTEHDLLLPVGHPLYIAWAAAIAALQSGGKLAMLHWQVGERRYDVVRAEVFAEQAGLEEAR